MSPDTLALKDENVLLLLVEASPDLIWSMLPDGKADYVNRTWKEYTGQSLADFQREGWLSVVHPEDVPCLREQWVKAAGQGQPFEAEFRLRRQDGVYAWFWGRTAPVKNADGQIVKWVGITRDITDRKEVRQALEDSERKARELIQFAPTAIYQMDFRTRRFTEVNDAMIAMSGYSRDELLRMDPFDLLDEPSQALFKERTRAWAAGERPDEAVEYRAITKDGRAIYVVLKTTFFNDADGQPLSAMVIAHDVTDRRQVESELRKSEAYLRKNEARLQQALSIDTVGVLFFDLKGAVTGSNEAFLRMSGYNREDLEAGRIRWDVMTPPEFMPESLAAIEELRVKGNTTPYEKQCLRKDGSRWWGLFAAKRLQSDENIEFVLDISERKQAESELRKSEANLRQSEAALQETNRAIQESREQLAIVFETLPVGVGLVDRQGKLLLSNLKMRRFVPTGLIPGLDDTRYGRWRAYHPDGRRFDRSEYPGARALRGERVLPGVEFLYTEDDGSETWTSVVAVPVWDREGEINGAVIVVTDIDASKRAAIALRQSEERFRTSIENLTEAFTIFSTVRGGAIGDESSGGSGGGARGKIIDFRYTYVNEATCQMTNRTQAELLNHLFLELWPNHRESGLFDKYVQVVETGQPLNEQAFTYDYGVGGRQQVSGAFDIRASKFGDGLIVTVDDVTEQARLEAERQQANQEREVHHRLAEQREKERQSIALDIHDGPIQTLSSLAFSLQFLKEAYPDPNLQMELSQIALSVKGAVQELRQVMNELRPPTLLRFGLAKAIQVHAENLRERYPQITWNLKLDNDEKVLPEQTCLALFRIYQEAITNIIRHSEANTAWVDYQVQPDQVVLEIRDNGKGFEQSQDIAALTSHQHFGLAGISERAQAIQGKLEIISQPGSGMAIRVSVPVGAGADRAGE